MSNIVEGVCCAYCAKFNTAQCPIITANNWSRWKNFCNEYESQKEGKVLEMFSVEWSQKHEI